MNTLSKQLIFCLMFAPLSALQHIPSHDPVYHYQIIQPYEVGYNYQLLKLVDEVFAKHKITYWAWGGTLLGAVRHQGFIPWDFDTDICISLEDHEKLLACNADFEKFDARLLIQEADGKIVGYRLKRVVAGQELYGHVDIFMMQHQEDRWALVNYEAHFFFDSEVEEIARYPFGPIVINGPVEYLPYLVRGYGEDVMTVARIMYTVNPQTGNPYPPFTMTRFPPALYEIIDPKIPLDRPCF